MSADKLRATITDDGRVTVETDDLAGPNHVACEQFLELVARMLGGPVEKVPRKEAHTHQHGFGHEHTHTHNFDEEKR